MKTRAFIVAGFAVLIFFGLIWADHQGKVPVPVIPQAHGHCVLPTATMRRIHMVLLRRVREQILRYGKKKPSERLTNCIACHVQRNGAGKPIPINKRGQFCEVCHAYVGVRVDCFVCHATVPEKATPVADFIHSHTTKAELHVSSKIVNEASASLQGESHD